MMFSDYMLTKLAKAHVRDLLGERRAAAMARERQDERPRQGARRDECRRQGARPAARLAHGSGRERVESSTESAMRKVRRGLAGGVPCPEHRLAVAGGRR